MIVAGSSCQQAKHAANLHVERLPPRYLAFAFEMNSFRNLDEGGVVSYWFLVRDDDRLDFSNYVAGKYVKLRFLYQLALKRREKSNRSLVESVKGSRFKSSPNGVENSFP